MAEAPESQESQKRDTPEKKAESSSVGDQLADLTLKIIRPGGVTVGSIGAGYLLFVQSDIPKAIASAVIGVVISYGAKMLQPLHEGNQRRFDQAGKAVEKAIDRTTNQVIAKTSGFEDRYLERQAWACEMDRPDIPREPVTSETQHKTIAALMLEQVYVPLSLDARAMLPGFRSVELGQQATEQCDRLDIWHFLANVKQDRVFRQLVILAWGGYGKTTLLKHIAHTYGTKRQPRNLPKLIPILLILRKYRDTLAKENPPSLPDLITTEHIPSLPDGESLTVSTDWAKAVLIRGDALIMLDGFDEVAKAQRPAVARWINTQMEQYRKSVFILTSRPKAYNDQDPGDRLDLATTLWVRDFDQSHRQQFVQQWYGCQEYYASGRRDTPEVRQRALESANELLTQVETRDELKALAKNPLLLNMIVTFHWRYPGAELPSRRVDLYRDICRLQLKDRPAARKLQTLLTQCDAQPILQRLALDMMQQHQERVERSILLNWLASYLTQAEETVNSAEFLDQVEQVSELLVRQEESYEFAHLSFQEYLAASQIAQQKQESLLYDHFHNDWWKQTILLYAAQTNPTTLIREAISRGATDLAYVCLQETTKQIDPSLAQELAALKQTVQDTRYAQLEEYLRNQQWREADAETDRLMLATVGKEAGQWLEPDDLRNFPCEDLQTLDQLWVNYSNGKFGFSVQKQIWIECGRPMEHNDDWETFRDRVGWRKEGDWLGYDNLIFDLNAPQGEFPFLCVWSVLWGGFRDLFSRVETCRV